MCGLVITWYYLKPFSKSPDRASGSIVFPFFCSSGSFFLLLLLLRLLFLCHLIFTSNETYIIKSKAKIL